MRATLMNGTRLALVAAVTIAVGCGGGGSGSGKIGGGSSGGSTGSGGMQTPQVVTFDILEEGQQSQHPLATAGGELVVRDNATWLQFWGQHKPNTRPLAVDFAQQQVICVFQGQQPSTGYAIDTQQAVQTGQDIELEVAERTPAPGSIQSRVITFPYQLVSFAASTGSVMVKRYDQLHTESLDKGDVSYHRYNDHLFTGAIEVFTDEAPFLSFWADHKSGLSPTPRPPSVVFTQDMVIAALQGYRTNGGFGITVVDVLLEQTGGELIILVEKDEVTGLTSVITNPFEVVKVPRGSFQTITVREDVEVPTTSLAQSSTSGYRYGDSSFTGENRAVLDDASWQQVWSDHTSNVIPAPQLPTVDFATESVVVAWMGYRTTGGYAIAVDSVVLTWKGDAEITLLSTAPAPGSITTQVITNPVDMVKVPKFTGALRVR
jgi:hypothetical protein